MRKLFPLFLLITIVLSACSKNDSQRLTLDTYDIELKSGDSKTVKVLSGDSNVNWRTENIYVATVDNGKVTALHVGKTMLLANNTAALVTVSPRYMLYNEPIDHTKWGMTKNDIYKLMGDKFPDKMEGNLFTYNIESPVNSFTTYEFNSNERLTSVHISVSKQNSSDLDQFLAERYQEIPGGSENEKHYFNGTSNSAATMLVSRSSYDNNHWLVSYKDVKAN